MPVYSQPNCSNLPDYNPNTCLEQLFLTNHVTLFPNISESFHHAYFPLITNLLYLVSFHHGASVTEARALNPQQTLHCSERRFHHFESHCTHELYLSLSHHLMPVIKALYSCVLMLFPSPLECGAL